MKIDHPHSDAEELILVGPILSQTVGMQLPQIAVDGGLHFSNHPLLWVGDGDTSVPPNSIPALLKTNQDLTDLQFCLSYIESWSWKRLHMFGFLGARRGHEFANLGELYRQFKSRAQSVEAIFYDRSMVPQVRLFQQGECSLEIYGSFSLLVFEKSQVTISGNCNYPAEDLTLEPFSGRGVSNRGDGLVQVRSSTPFLILLERT